MIAPAAGEAAVGDDAVDGGTLARLTGAKTVSNVALRWIPLFLPTLARAFGASTSQLTTVLGLGELAGMSTVVVGRSLDRGRERSVMAISLVVVAISALVALSGSLVGFAVSVVLLVTGVANLTVAGQVWIAQRVDYGRRARAIGIFETSWAVALLVGAPLVAWLINVWGWRGPFVAVSIAALAAALMVAVSIPGGTPGGSGSAVVTVPTSPPSPTTPTTPPGGPDGRAGRRGESISASAWLVMVGSACVAMAGLSVFVVSGTWLDDDFGVSTGGIGAVAVAFGATELVASISVATFTDRVGKLRSTVCGLAALLLGLVTMLAAGGLPLALAGTLVFLLGFEFAFVSSLSLVSEAMPSARGATIAISNGVGTIARAVAAVGSGLLYSGHGIAGTAALSATAAVAAAGCLLVSRRR